MLNNNKIHASLALISGKGVLLKGKSGSGKSDLLLRLIQNKNAELVADDIVELYSDNEKLFGKADEKLLGLLEVRGIGIVKMPYVKASSIDLVVNLVEKPEDIERLPDSKQEEILGIEIPSIDLYAKEVSAAEKIIVKLQNNLLATDVNI